MSYSLFCCWYSLCFWSNTLHGLGFLAHTKHSTNICWIIFKFNLMFAPVVSRGGGAVSTENVLGFTFSPFAPLSPTGWRVVPGDISSHEYLMNGCSFQCGKMPVVKYMWSARVAVGGSWVQGSTEFENTITSGAPIAWTHSSIMITLQLAGYLLSILKNVAQTWYFLETVRWADPHLYPLHSVSTLLLLTTLYLSFLTLYPQI